MRHIGHLRGDDAGAGKFILRHHLPILANAHQAVRRAGRHELIEWHEAIVLGLHRAGCCGGKTAPGNPRFADLRQAIGQIDCGGSVCIRARGIIDPDRRLAG